MKIHRKKEVIREARHKIENLFEQADLIFKDNKKLANRYVSLARKIGMKLNLRLPSRLQKRFCKHCYSFLVPGINCRIRTRENKVVYYCLECKKYMRFPFIKEKKLKRNL